MDDETKNWPIPDNFAEEFDGLKYKMAAQPLPLYYKDHLVEPAYANQIMNGAIVEVQLTIQHWRIQDFDSFQALAEKVTILRLGPIHVPSHYKRPNPDKELENQPEVKKVRLDSEESASKGHGGEIIIGDEGQTVNEEPKARG
ncbi:hypothetical protein F4604DRAFT_1683003 [Suillus subluteus]|nr:hypothetical protein F4604DRAFT_1683003 [Suillus subluteus]